MKNLRTIGLSTGLLALVAVASAQSVDVTVNGRPLADTGRTIDGRVFVPMRSIFQTLGANVFYSSATKTVRANKGNTEVYLPLGSREVQVNGRTVMLDAPARAIDGTTFVPLRFVGETLGASVAWRPAERLVAIRTDGSIETGGNAGRLTPEEREERRREREEREAREREEIRLNTVEAGTIIPVLLNNELNSKDLAPGERFAARLDTAAGDYYGNFPVGTVFQGRVVESEAQNGRNGGQLDLVFDRMLLPSGRTVSIDGTLASLNAEAVTRDDNGRIVARPGARGNNAILGGALGGVAGLIFGGNRRLENTVLGGALGALIGSQIRTGGQPQRDVVLKPGTRMGIKINRDVTLYDRNGDGR